MICPWAGAKTLIFTNFLHTGPLWNSVGWWGLIRSIEAKKIYPKKEKILRPGLKKKSQTALTTLVSTGTGRDEKGAPTPAPLVPSGPVKPMACSRRLKNICHVILDLKWLKYEFQNVLDQAVCSAQSELFFRLLLKNTVHRVQIAAYPKMCWKGFLGFL